MFNYLRLLKKYNELKLKYNELKLLVDFNFWEEEDF